MKQILYRGPKGFRRCQRPICRSNSKRVIFATYSFVQNWQSLRKRYSILVSSALKINVMSMQKFIIIF